MRPSSVELLHALAARPRATGSDAIVFARDYCARELRQLGLVVRELRFEFSALPGRLGTPLFGAAALALVAIAGHLGSHGSRWFPSAIILLGAAILVAAGLWFAKRGVLDVPLLRRQGVNLEATRPGESPSLWLCAHLDTKSQPIPSLARVAGIVVESMGFLGTAALSIAAVAGASAPFSAWVAMGLLTLAGSVPVVLSVVGTSSPGALDNASGVATVIAAARELADRPSIGVLITDAEELGLAGARAWAREHGGGMVLNCDGVDDTGEIKLMYSGTPPSRLLDAAARATTSTGIAHVPTRLVVGILTDSVAFSDAGMASVTFSRGSLRSLARVHSRRDSIARLRGDGIPETAALITATARHLL